MSSEPRRIPQAVRMIVASIAGIIAGWTIWAASPIVTGEIEPWDSRPWHYLSALFLASFVVTLISQRHFWFGPVAISLGQIGFMELWYRPVGPPILPSFLAVAIFGVWPTVLGALSARLLSRAFVDRRSHRDSHLVR